MKSKRKLFKSLLASIMSMVLLTTGSLYLPVSATPLEAIPEGVYYIRHVKSGLYLDIDNAYIDSGTNVKLFWSNPSYGAQEWFFERLDTGEYCIRANLDRDYALNVYTGSAANNANVNIWYVGYSEYAVDDDYIPDYARWRISYNLDGTLSFAAMCSNYTKFLRPYLGGTTAGTNVVQYQFVNDQSQRWILEEVNRTTYLSSWDLVDSGKHLDWDGSTKYQTLFNNAVETWNNYKSGVIRKDTLLTLEDVYIYDSTDNQPYLAATSPDGFIVFITPQMDALINDQCRQKTITHELGHALGLAHSTRVGDVMQQGELAYTSLSLNDKASYDAAYNRY